MTLPRGDHNLSDETVDTCSAEVLVARITAGEELAEEELVRLYQKPILAIATARTRDCEAARDLTQEILLAVLRAIRAGQLREVNKLAAFIQGTARNLINNYLRTRSRRSECALESVSVPAEDPVQEQECAERRRLVQQELRSFSGLDQQILLFSIVDGHSLAVIAERLNMSHDAVRARKSRLIRKITGKFSAVSQKMDF